MTAAAPMGRPWSILLGDYPNTRALRTGAIESPVIPLVFADVAVPNRAFKRAVRDVEFDVAELALMTFLMARSRDVPLYLLPIALFARNPLSRLVCRAGDDRIDACDLEGRRVGVRSYTTTTAVWARALLADEFDIDSRRIQWVTCEEGHVAGVADPGHVQRTAGTANLADLLRTGHIDAAIVEPVPATPDVAPVITDADAVWRRWRARTGAETVNHIVVVKASLANDARAMRALFDLFRASREQAEAGAGADTCPLGFDHSRRTLEVAIAAATADGLLARALTPDNLVTDALRAL